MEKAKYRVYTNYTVRHTYVTTTRNCEDMIFQIRLMHESSATEYFKITRQTATEKEKDVYIKYERKKKHCWESELYN